MSEQKKQLKRKRMAWTDASEAVLLELWQGCVEELKGHRKNGHIYAEMAERLSKLGFSYSSREVHVKLQNFTQRYRKEKARIASGGSPSTWCHYEKVHQIIGGFEVNSFTKLTLESIDDSTSSLLLSPCTPSAVPSEHFPVSLTAATSTDPARSHDNLIYAPERPEYSSAKDCQLSNSATTTTDPAKKRSKLDFQSIIMENFEKFSTNITEHLKKSDENERELIEIEKKKAEMLESIVKDNKELKDALISFLNK